jgi:hypothetical protein
VYFVAIHEIKNPETAFPRGRKLQLSEGAPAGTRALQFYPSTDATRVTCLWEGTSADSLQEYVDEALGDSSVNTIYEVQADQAFAERPLGLQAAPMGAVG